MRLIRTFRHLRHCKGLTEEEKVTPAAELLQPDSNPALYVSSVFTLYVDLPDTPLRASPSSGRRWRACALATVRRSNCTCGFPAYSFHEGTNYEIRSRHCRVGPEPNLSG